MYLDHMKRRVKNSDTLLEIFAFLDRKECGRVSREDVRCLNHFNVCLYLYTSSTFFETIVVHLHFYATVQFHFLQVETCLELANIQLPEEDLDIMLQNMVDDDGTVRTSNHAHSQPCCACNVSSFFCMLSNCLITSSLQFCFADLVDIIN
jgi:hypothetical protein